MSFKSFPQNEFFVEVPNDGLLERMEDLGESKDEVVLISDATEPFELLRYVSLVMFMPAVGDKNNSTCCLC